MKTPAVGALVVGLFAGTACLPGDIRPEPGHIFVAIEGSKAAVEGFTTDDGWTLHFDKLLVGMGYVLLAGESCNNYADARYDRLFDLAVPGRQKVGEVYGLEECEIQMHHWAPSSTAYLGTNVTEADRTFMRKRHTTWIKPSGRTAMYLRGNASRGTVTKRFDWRFTGRLTLTDCMSPKDGSIGTSMKLKAGDDQRPALVFHPEDLFRDGVEPNAPRRFEALALADTNDDGLVSLREVSKIPAPLMEWSPEMIAEAGVPDGGVIIDDESRLQGWARFMRQILWPSLFAFDGRPCQDHPEKSVRDEFEFEIDF
ncbi:MAG TPA: hypothetical protein PKA58_29900 [Polyangium sp.]|nr:hypothetical protein [Polyangium sp.]